MKPIAHRENNIGAISHRENNIGVISHHENNSCEENIGATFDVCGAESRENLSGCSPIQQFCICLPHENNERMTKIDDTGSKLPTFGIF